MAIWALAALAAVFVAAAVWVRIAPHDVTRWHVDPATVGETKRLNDFRVAPEGGDRASPVYDMSPDALMARFHQVAMGAPRTTLLADSGGYATYVTRSKVVGYPDYMSVRAAPAEGGGAQLHIWSRARFGLRDFGVNEARVSAWLDRL